MERIDALHLEARDLEDDRVELLVGVRSERLAEIFAHEGAKAAPLEDRADERGHGALAVRAADREKAGRLSSRSVRRLVHGPDGERHLVPLRPACACGG